jgi:protein-tyrosine phosphatase
MTIKVTDIRLKSVLNFRDIANSGSFVKKGRIYRSANLDSISNSDIAILQQLGIKAIIDLRGPSEQKKRKKEIKGISVVSLPLDFQAKTRERLYPHFRQKNPEEKILEVSNSLYLEIAAAAAPVLAEIIEMMLSREAGGVLIHCQAGKDRTGIIIALLHLIAGTERKDIIDDFLRSNDELLPHFKRVFRLRKIISFGLFPYATVLFAVEVKRRNIESVIDLIMNSPGGVEEYLGSAGFEISKLTEFRNRILENGKG